MPLTFELWPGTQVAFCVYRLSYAGGVAVPRTESDDSDHQEPRRVLHHAGLCPLGK